MSKLSTTRMTAEAFFEFVHQPENDNKSFELVQGEVIELPAPTKPHGFVCLNIGRLLGNYTFEVGGMYAVGNDSGVILARDPDTVRGPDVAIYNDASTFEELHPKYGEVAPLLAVEVLSPSDRPGKVARKVADYLKAGTQMVWLLDPETKSVIVHRMGREAQVIEIPGELTGEEVLPGFRCLVADLFRLPHRP